MFRNWQKNQKIEIEFYQSNIEGEIVTKIQDQEINLTVL